MLLTTTVTMLPSGQKSVRCRELDVGKAVSLGRGTQKGCSVVQVIVSVFRTGIEYREQLLLRHLMDINGGDWFVFQRRAVGIVLQTM